MKKLVSILLCMLLMVQVTPAVFGAEISDVYYSQGFEDVSDLSGVALVSENLPATLSVADASDEGIGEAGNSVLKFDMEAATSTVDGGIEFNLQDAYPEIAINQELQFSIDFYKTDAKSTIQFFETYDAGNKGKYNGLVQLIRDGAPAYNSRMKDGLGNLIYGSDTGATNDEKGIIASKEWYRLTINWAPSSTNPDNNIKQVALTRLSDSKELFSVKDVPVTNPDWPMASIVKFKIGILTYNSYPAQQIYFDNISIKKVKEIAPLELVSPTDNSVVESANTLTLEFNQEVDEDSLDGISVTSENSDNPVIVSVVKNTGDGKKAEITFESPLVPGGKYTVSVSGVKSSDGADCISESIDINVKKDVSDYAYYQDFESVSDVSDAVVPSSDLNGITLSLADASDEGIGEAGNRVLKLDMEAPKSTVDGEIEFLLNSGNIVIPIDRRYEFSVDFYKTDAKSTVQFFETYDPNGRSKSNGLVQLIRDGAPAYNARLKDGLSNLIYGSDTGATNDEKGIIPMNQWYRLTVNWTPSSTKPDNNLECVTLTRLSDNTEIVNVKNIPVTNADYPMNSITALKFGILTYNGYPAQQIYFDNVTISELEAIEELKLVSPSDDTIAENTNSITMEFNQEVDEETLDLVYFTSENFADPKVMSAVKNDSDGKKVDVTFEYPLVAGGKYTVFAQGVKNTDGNECITDAVSFEVKKIAPENAYVAEDFSSLSNFRSNNSNTTIDASVSNVCEDGKWFAKIAPSAANNTANGNMGDMLYVTDSIALDSVGVMFETDYYPIGKGLEDRIFYIREAQAPWGRFGSGLFNVNVNSGGTPTFKLCDGNTPGAVFLTGTAGHVYNLKYHLSKKDGVTYGKAYIYDYNTGVLTESEEMAMANTNFNVINEIGFAQKTWGAGETRYGNLYVYPASAPKLAGSDVAGEILEDYANLSFDVKFDSVLDINSVDNIKVMAGTTEIESVKTLIDDSKTVRVDVTGSLPELSVITVVCDGVANTYYQTLESASFTFQTASSYKVAGCTFDKESIVGGEKVTASVSFKNNVDDSKNAAIIIAVYEKDGNVYTMKNVSANTNAVVIEGASAIPVSVDIPADIDASNAVVKVMVLDNMTNMIPLCADFVIGE